MYIVKPILTYSEIFLTARTTSARGRTRQGGKQEGALVAHGDKPICLLTLS